MDELERIRRAYALRDSQEKERLYSLWRPGALYTYQERERAVLAALREVLGWSGGRTLAELMILDVGCGRGDVLLEFVRYGARPERLVGIDVLPDRIEAARRAYPEIHLICGNAEYLDFADGHFDLVLLFTIFTSILDDGMAHNVATEVRRVLKPGGAVLWYDFRYNNPWNPDVRGMTKRLIRQFFPGFEMRLRTVTLLPPLASRQGRLTPMLYPLLAALPLLRTHYVGLLVKPT